jgi:hypothetical protein
MNADTARGEKQKKLPKQLLLRRLHAATGPRKSARFRIIRVKPLEPRIGLLSGKVSQTAYRGFSRITRMNADTARGKTSRNPSRYQRLLSRLHAATGPRKSARFRVIRGKAL